MTSALFFLLAGVCLWMIGWGLSRPERAIQFPFLAAAGFCAYVLPQLYGASQLPLVPRAALDKTLFMSVLCLLAAHLGYVENKRPAQLLHRWRFDYNRLQLASIVLTIAGAYFFYQMSLLAPEVSLAHGGAWTGIITIYAFFAGLTTLGFVLAVNLYLNRPSWATFSVAIFGMALYLDRIIIHGRRRALIELGLIILMALWFHRRWVPPRWAVVVAVLGGALVINAIGDYRGVMLERDRSTWTGAGIAEVSQIDFLGNLRRRLEGQQISDGLNAIFYIDAVDRQLNFDYGLSLYNRFVHSYVPGQLIGHDLKNQLKIDFGQDFGDSGHVFQTGTTSTGIGDAFMSFWYFGFVIFLLIGLIMSRWFLAAERGSFVAQVTVISVAYYAVAAFGFSTDAFFLRFVFVGAFLLPVFLYARVPARGRLSRWRNATRNGWQGSG